MERLGYLDILASVRAFYLDLAEWAWKIPPGGARGWRPVLSGQKIWPGGSSCAAARPGWTPGPGSGCPCCPSWPAPPPNGAMTPRRCSPPPGQAQPGQEFTAAGQTLVRSIRPHAAPGSIWAHDPAGGKQRQLNLEEDHAFWAWAIIEVLRHTGIRAEELLELSHHSLIQYRLPGTGELVPLLQIAPSKTDTERLLVVSPELADVLSAIISRIRDASGAVPLVRGRDRHERTWMPPAPLLFQRRTGTENHMITGSLVAGLLDAALAQHRPDRPGDRRPLHFSPHDFRRIFITDAVLNGLPPHIAQVIAGHQDISVTMGYKAVYPEEAIKSHLAFLARRRALRPGEEYRIPTDQEWQEFLGHFQRRKVSTGTCGRAFGTPCIHEHACIRCPMLWPDPAQRDRLAEIRDNLTARIAEAQEKGWLGEVEGLQISLAGAREKLAQIDNANRNTTTADLGIPAFPAPSQRDRYAA